MTVRAWKTKGSGPTKTITAESKAKVYQMVPDDSRIKVRGIAKAMKMCKERVCHILNPRFRHEKTICVFVDVRPKMSSNVHFQRSVVQFRGNRSHFWLD